jgi:hypothetical protein
MGRLSGLLREVPLATFTSPGHLAAQVILRLPYQPTATSGKTFLEIGWWMIPVGLLAAWVFAATSFLVSDLLSAANSLGFLTSISSWLFFGPADQGYWSAIIGQFGILSGNGLDWAVLTEALSRASIQQLSLQIPIALLYLSWMAIWWARHTRHQRQGHGRPLEG